MHEFDLIKYYFSDHHKNGDDAADITPSTTERLVTSIDTSILGKHFKPSTSPHAIGHKALAVSLSDIAAMGAKPTSCLLSLTLPDIDKKWLDQFAQGFHDIANQFNVSLVGGDTTQGPLSISTVVFGTLPKEITPLWRHGAQPDDLIVVSGELGAAAHALHHTTANQIPLNYPTPRIALGIALRNLATSCIDISDGLTQDLSHILNASQVGAEIKTASLPLGGTLKDALNGGDDYELCFTVPKSKNQTINILSQQLNLPLTIIGTVTQHHGLRCLDPHGHDMPLSQLGFQHF